MANIKDLIQSIESSDSSFDEKLAAINAMEETLVAMRAQEQEAIDDNVSLIVEAIRVMERKVEAQLEVAKAIVPEKGDKGDRGQDGRDGQNGRDGKDGKDGKDGQNGQDGQDGVSVTDAHIDFDGSLTIVLSNGREINVGEVVAPDLAERIKVITNGGGTSQGVLDTLDSLQTQINNLVISGGMVYPGAGIPVSTGTAWSTSKATPSGDIVGTTGTQTLTNKTVEKLVLNDGYTEEVFAITDGATVNLDPNNGSIQTWTLGANRTPGQANWAAGQSITLMVDDGTASTITWTTLAPVWETNGGTAPTLSLTGFTVIVLWKVGTTIYGARVGDA
jgi:hypothetical protein